MTYNSSLLEQKDKSLRRPRAGEIKKRGKGEPRRSAGREGKKQMFAGWRMRTETHGIFLKEKSCVLLVNSLFQLLIEYQVNL